MGYKLTFSYNRIDINSLLIVFSLFTSSTNYSTSIYPVSDSIRETIPPNGKVSHGYLDLSCILLQLCTSSLVGFIIGKFGRTPSYKTGIAVPSGNDTNCAVGSSV